MESVIKDTTEDAKLSTDLENALNLSDNESEDSQCSGGSRGFEDAGHSEIPQTAREEEVPEDECFYDCTESLEREEQKMKESDDLERDVQKMDDSEDDLDKDKLVGEQNIELEEEHLKELEKEMPEEEKQRRREESEKLKEEGNDRFKKADYIEAENCYTTALGICPYCYQKERSILYSNRGAARMKLNKEEDAIKDCSKAIELNPNYIRALLRRAELYEKTEKLDEALEDYKSILEKDPSVHQAREACMRLPRQIEERNERLKQEMMSKLKDLGNMLLRPFGLSTENFQVNQDNSSGSYSVNFVQNPNNNR